MLSPSNVNRSIHGIFAALPAPSVRTGGGQTNVKPGQGRTHVDESPLLTQPVIDRIVNSVKTRKPELWAGDVASAKSSKGATYGTGSEADMALASTIAFQARHAGVQGDDAVANLVLHVFGMSALARRDKWQQREDYRARTVAKAVKNSAGATLQTPVFPIFIGGSRPAAAGGAGGGGAPTVTGSSNAPVIMLGDAVGENRNGKLFAMQWQGVLVYIKSRGAWMRWLAEKRWALCEKGEEMQFAKATAERILQQASAAFSADPEKGKRLMQEATAAHKLYGMQAMLTLAQTEPGMSVLDRELDSDPHLLGVQNGMVDLRTGQLLPNKPEMLITRYCIADYSEGALCPTWLQFLEEVFQGNKGIIHTVQQLLGYTMTGLSTEEILVICYGFGSNGKSVFSNVIHTILGGYGIMAPPSLLTARSAGDSSVRNDLAALAGARYLGINELQAGDRLDEQIVKMLAGREPITARFLHREFFTFQPTFTPWLRTNHKPIITGTDDGIWRRLVMIPFKRKFENHEKDPHLEAKLMAERDGILMWMLEGARLYFKWGLQICPTIKAENAQYRSDSDAFAEFLGELTVTKAAAKVEQSRLFDSWRIWCQQTNFPPGSKKAFTRRLAERGFTESKSNGKRYYTGLEFAPLTP